MNKNPTIFLRFENNDFFEKIRAILFKEQKYWKSIDNTVKNNIWIPKCTLIHEDLKKQNLSEIINFINKNNPPNETIISEIFFIDFTKNQKEILNLKI